jgi:hypothetical protein
MGQGTCQGSLVEKKADFTPVFICQNFWDPNKTNDLAQLRQLCNKVK